MNKEELLKSLKYLNSDHQVFYLSVKVIPNAAKTELIEVLPLPENEQVVKIKVAAVPEKGKANKELCRYLADFFDVPKSQVSVTQGATNQRKIVKVIGASFT